MCVHICVYMCIYIYTHTRPWRRRRGCEGPPTRPAPAPRPRRTLGWRYLSSPTCLICRLVCFVFFRRVKHHHSSLHDSPLWKNACFRQVVLDKWFPLRTIKVHVCIHQPLGIQCARSPEGLKQQVGT